MVKEKIKIGLFDFESCGFCSQKILQSFLSDKNLCLFYDIQIVSKIPQTNIDFDFLIFSGDQKLIGQYLEKYGCMIIKNSLIIGNCPGRCQIPEKIEIITGCPVDQRKIISFFESKINLADRQAEKESVCFYCPISGHCLLKNPGYLCFGPVTNGSCQAACLKEGLPCSGCQEELIAANYYKLEELARKNGFEAFRKNLNIFNNEK
jgi:hypothetical protein